MNALPGFFASRLPAVQDALQNWWEHGPQEVPCILFTAGPEDPSTVPHTDDLVTWWTDVDFILARQMALLDGQTYYGQAVPYHYVDLGASAMAGVLGARMEYLNRETVWAYPSLESVEQVLEVEVDRHGFFYQLLRQTTERSVALAAGHHFVTLFALEGIADLVGALYGIENLLVDMIARPAAVSRAMEHVKRIWIDLYDEFQGILSQSGNRGGIGWAGIWAPGTTFPIQEDFSYMISNEMFRTYCLPHILDMVDAMEYPLYHLDGVAALAHLDSLLAIEELKVIQWVPGAGKERLDLWYDVICHILDAGKSVQVYGQAWEVDGLVQNVGARGMLFTLLDATPEQAEQLIDRFAVP